VSGGALENLFVTGEQFRITMPPEATWEWCLGGNWFALTVRPCGDPPNWFHRFMQRWVLGIHWRRITGAR
jgi:hypothetical protein